MFSNSAGIRRSVVGVLVALLAAGLVGAPAASAKSRKANLSASAPVNAATGKINGRIKGSPIGSCKLTGVLQPPKALETVKCKGGSFKLTVTSTSGAANDVTGSWKASGGSGKFKGIKGGGKIRGKISTTRFKYTGSLNY